MTSNCVSQPELSVITTIRPIVICSQNEFYIFVVFPIQTVINVGDDM